MKVYLAGVGSNYKYLENLPHLAFLVSYHYISGNGPDNKAIKYATQNGIPLFLDSGAFSAMTVGAKIDLSTYSLYCDIYGRQFEVIMSLDVIGDADATWKNHSYMRKEGIKSLCTFHLDSDWKYLIQMLESGDDYIALAVKGKQGEKERVRIFLDECFELIQKYNPTVKTHGLGLTTPSIIRDYPLTSIDGTTWMTGASQYGRIMYHNEGAIQWIRVSDQADLEANWHLIGDDICEGWDLKKGRTKQYERVSLRYNAKSLIDLVEYWNARRK